jgi:hypothetical protein
LTTRIALSEVPVVVSYAADLNRIDLRLGDNVRDAVLYDHCGGKGMTFRLFMTTCFVALVTFMGATAQAATVVEGPVNVDSGWGYEAVDSGTPVQPGNSVMAQPGGSGQIVYDDGCSVPVGEGQVVLVEPQSPCVEAASADGGLPTGVGHYALYVLPVAAIIVGLVFLLKDDDKPASP